LGKKQDVKNAGDGRCGDRPWLTGQMLIAMPGMADPRFEKTVILICSHAPDGAMGLVINRLFGDLSFGALLNQFDIAPLSGEENRLVHYGGPVEPVRGFVLHSADYKKEATTEIGPDLCLTATVEILRALAEGCGPARSLLVLGYAGWAAGQLEAEIQANGWLTAPADLDIVFDVDTDKKWRRALACLGVEEALLSTDIGHA